MTSLAELPELVGFFSYSRRDDDHSGGALTRLRARIYDELRLQLGRDFRLWQDTAAIPDGTLWEDEIKRAIAESVFFIPIVTPSAVGSSHCKYEFDSFLRREDALGRHNLVFPILYIRVPGLEDERQRRENELFKIICARQYVDWQKLRLRDWASTEVAERVENFCRNIVEALQQQWASPEERRAKREVDSRRDAEEEKRRSETVEAEGRAEDERRAQERRRQEEIAAARQKVEQDRLAREADEKQLQRETEERARPEKDRRRQDQQEALQIVKAPDRAAGQVGLSSLASRFLAGLLLSLGCVYLAASAWMSLQRNDAGVMTLGIIPLVISIVLAFAIFINKRKMIYFVVVAGIAALAADFVFLYMIVVFNNFVIGWRWPFVLAECLGVPVLVTLIAKAFRALKS